MRQKPFSNGARGFSLVELLVVLAIMGILSALAVSSVSSLRSTALAATGNQMVDVMAMARQNSISKNDYTAVVIMKTGASAASAYCLLELPNQQDGSQGTTWVELTPWKYLPKGVVFESGQTNDTFITTSSWTALPAATSSVLSNYNFQGSTVPLSSAAVVQCYQPDGTLRGASQSLALRLIQGTADPSSGNTTNNHAADYYDLYFLANTGTTKIGLP